MLWTGLDATWSSEIVGIWTEIEIELFPVHKHFLAQTEWRSLSLMPQHHWRPAWENEGIQFWAVHFHNKKHDLKGHARVIQGCTTLDSECTLEIPTMKDSYETSWQCQPCSCVPAFCSKISIMILLPANVCKTIAIVLKSWTHTANADF